MKGGGVHCEDGGVEPICEWHDSKIDVVVCGGWAVDDHGTHKSFAVLHRIVRMVPLQFLSDGLLIVGAQNLQ